MAKVLVTLKVLPEDVETDLSAIVEEVRKRLPKDYELLSSGEEPIAFGLKALKLYVAIPEMTAGGTENLEEIVRSIKGVSQVEVEMVTRMR